MLVTDIASDFVSVDIKKNVCQKIRYVLKFDVKAPTIFLVI